MEKVLYKTYCGTLPSLFVAWGEDGTKAASELVNELCNMSVRTCYFETGSKDVNAASLTAEAIRNCSAAVFVLTKKAVEELEFRNIINFAINEHKKIICIKAEEFKLSHGMDMQLANIETIDYSSAAECTEKMKNSEIITQNVLGQTAERKNINRKKQIVFTSIILAGIIAFAIGAFFIVRERIEYINSAEYVLRNADGQSYVDGREFAEDAIAALEGVSIGELDLSESGLHNLEGVDKICMKSINIAGNPDINTLYPLFDCKELEKIKISQDMLALANRLSDSFEIVVTG